MSAKDSNSGANRMTICYNADFHIEQTITYFLDKNNKICCILSFTAFNLPNFIEFYTYILEDDF